MSIEERLAETLFNTLHGLHHRRRSWAMQPEEDLDVEWGRNTYRAMALAALEVMENEMAKKMPMMKAPAIPAAPMAKAMPAAKPSLPKGAGRHPKQKVTPVKTDRGAFGIKG